MSLRSLSALACIIGWMLVAPLGRTQTTIDVSAASYTTTGGVTTYYYTPLQNGVTGAFLDDPRADQQTGQYGDDLVGNSADNPGFMMRYGQINGVDYLAFRIRYNIYDANAYDNNGKTRLGMDGDGDGDLDLFFGVDFTNNQGTSIGFQAPGTGLNASPNTTTIGNNFIPVFESGDTSLDSSLLTLQDGVTFNYMQVTSANTPGFTNFASNKVNTLDPDAYMTFAVPFLFLKEALEDASGVALSPASFVRFIAFTATQNNAINQDVFGSVGISGDVRFDASGGGFTQFTNSYGSPVPEPATYAQLGTLLMAGLGVRWLQLRRSRKRDVRTASVR